MSIEHDETEQLMKMLEKLGINSAVVTKEDLSRIAGALHLIQADIERGETLDLSGVQYPRILELIPALRKGPASMN